MIQTTYNAETFYLFTPTPNWEDGVKLKLFIPSTSSKGRSDREATRALGHSLRVSLFRFSTWLEGRELKEMVSALQQRTTERLLVPLWCDAAYADEIAVFQAGLYLTVVNDNGAVDLSEDEYELHSERENHTLSGKVLTMPVIICDFQSFPSAAMNDDELVDYSFSFKEDGEAEYALSCPQDLLGEPLAVESTSYPYFPFSPNMRASQEAGSVDLLVNTRTVGQHRRLQKDHDGALPARPLKLSLDTFSHEETRDLISFWCAQKGAVGRFWVSSQLAPGRMVSAPSASEIEVDDSTFFYVGQVIVLEDHQNGTGELNYHPAIITEISGAVLTLDRDLPTLQLLGTGIRELILASFEKNYIDLDFDTDQTFSTSLECRERVPERNEEETPGATVGALKTRASLMTFWDEMGNEHYFTAYEKNLQHGGNTFLTYPISHGVLNARIDLTDNTKVKVEAQQGSIFTNFFNVSSGGVLRLHVKIQRVELNDDETVSAVKRTFIGECTKPKLDYTTLTLDAKILARDIESRIPRLRFQRPCNYAFGSVGCGVDVLLHRYDAIVSAIDVSARRITVTGITRQNGDLNPSELGTMLSGGYMGLGDQKWLILLMTLEDGIYQIYLGSNEHLPELGDAVFLQAGCNGSPSECQDYENYENYGGNRVADGNLSLVAVSSDLTGGGKK